MQCRLCLQVSAVAGHHQEEDRGAHRARVHQEGGQRQEGLHVPRLRGHSPSCHIPPEDCPRKDSAPVISAEKIDDNEDDVYYFVNMNDLVGVSETDVVFFVVFFCRFHFSYNDIYESVVRVPAPDTHESINHSA